MKIHKDYVFVWFTETSNVSMRGRNWTKTRSSRSTRHCSTDNLHVKWNKNCHPNFNTTLYDKSLLLIIRHLFSQTTLCKSVVQNTHSCHACPAHDYGIFTSVNIVLFFFVPNFTVCLCWDFNDTNDYDHHISIKVEDLLGTPIRASIKSYRAISTLRWSHHLLMRNRYGYQ